MVGRGISGSGGSGGTVAVFDVVVVVVGMGCRKVKKTCLLGWKECKNNCVVVAVR